ncbi:unnamed protein product [Gongylonema pulchrum]|uniref:G_PROTEIN_RECEP_F1_2 domain-containing protein n=1 Tax=Gongylonema pulchrum TaxID=637853 RepID=A0A183E1L6_9BILA|nr:unnamed protein product [Gongylonema pulchrum]
MVAKESCNSVPQIFIKNITFRKMVKLTEFVILPVAIFGLFGNSQLLYATWKFKKLHHRNGILVGLLAFFDLVN